jgi:hypothetical protein
MRQQYYMLLIYSTIVSLFFSIFLEHNEAFAPSMNEFKNSVTVYISLRRRSTAARLLAIVGSNPTGGIVCCECCVLSGTGLCDELITRPEESYQLWCVIVCDRQRKHTK